MNVDLVAISSKVWDAGSGLEDAEKEERKGSRQGDYKDQVDRSDRTPLSLNCWIG